MGIVDFGKKKLHEAVEADRERQKDKKNMKAIEKAEFDKTYKEEAMRQARQRGHDAAVAKLTKKKKPTGRPGGVVFKGF